MLRSGSYEEISLMPEDKNKFSRWAKLNKKTIIIVSVVIVVLIAVAIGLGLHFSGTLKPKHPCASAAQKIIHEALYAESLAYPRLGTLCNTFGSRFSGSQSLEDALDWMVQGMAGDNLTNAHHEDVLVPRWIRGTEYLNMNAPYNRSLGMLGLGGSVGTNGQVLEAEVVVVSSFDDLQTKANLVPGKIVLFNVPFVTYGSTVRYRSTGGIEAAKLGAVGALVRSITPYSLYTPHTGSTSTATPIPFAAVTVEDAEWLSSLQNINVSISVSLYMEAHFLNDSLSSNVMAEITGSMYPKQVVAIGGHTDSWDVGQGAMDDGGGVLVAWEAVRLLHKLGLKPKRTVRVVGWVNEENGLRGGTAYALSKASENETHIFAIESDGGATTPYGLQYYQTTTDEAVDMLTGIARLLKPIGADGLQRGGGGADIEPLVPYKTPVAGLWTDMSKYFWFHHTNADTFDKMDDMQMRKCVATMAVHAYCIADAESDLPKLN